MAWKLHITGPARTEIQEIWQYGYKHFGARIADDYDNLIKQALSDLAENPFRIGSKRLPDRDDELYSYPLEFSKNRAEGHIKNPSHAVFYFTVENNTVVIASIATPYMEPHRCQGNNGKNDLTDGVKYVTIY